MNAVIQTLSRIGIVPVIAIDDASKAVPLAKALAAGGLNAAEITFRTPAGEEALRQIAREMPEMLVGAGTVLTREQVDRAADAGARFLVSPGFHSEVTEYALSKGLLMLPGTATPGEMEQAMALGLDIVKFFPAEQNGGVAKLKALAGPYPNLRWMPTGGINVKNMMDYLSFDRVPFCGGTWMVKKELIQQERWEEITAICREAVKTMLGLELGHIGINDTSPESAERTAEAFAALLGLEHKPGANSDFAGKCVEVLKKPGRGKNGHIAIACSNVDRAEYHLARRGYRFLEETRITDALGTRVIYLDLELGGFAIHLSRK